MKKKIKANIQFYGIVALFIFLVTIVEIIKTTEAKTYTQVFEHQQDSQALLVLPLFSIAIVLLLAIPRKNFRQ